MSGQILGGDLTCKDGLRAGMIAVPGDGTVDFAPLARFVTVSGYRLAAPGFWGRWPTYSSAFSAISVETVTIA